MADIKLLEINKQFFKQFDTDSDGCISKEELRVAIQSDETGRQLPQHIIDALFNQSDTNYDGKISFAEFEEMIKKPENDVAFGSLKKRFLTYMNFVLPPMPRRFNDQHEELSLSDQCSCWPPPIVMLLLSVVQITLYILDFNYGYDNTNSLGPIAEVLVYDPTKRKEAWRFITYMFVHLGTCHLITNMVIQIILGTILECVHRGHRIFVVYLAGVLLGSLWNTIVDPGVKLAGASGGVYSLITAHIATIIINWSEMQYPIIQITIISVIIIYDLGSALHNRFISMAEKQIGVGAHFFGALAGLLVGIMVLRNIKVTRAEIIIRRITMVLYFVLMLISIGINVFYPQHFLPERIN